MISRFISPSDAPRGGAFTGRAHDSARGGSETGEVRLTREVSGAGCLKPPAPREDRMTRVESSIRLQIVAKTCRRRWAERFAHPLCTAGDSDSRG